MTTPNTVEVSPTSVRIRTFLGEILKSSEIRSQRVRPIVKWAGGKQWLAAAAKSLAPLEWKGRYFEPFAGGAAFFFSLAPDRAVLADSNSELIRTYAALKHDADRIIDLLDSYSYEKKLYYYLRDRRPRSPHRAAARFIFLNRTCWNGLYRVNLRGEFNTPFGNFRNPTILDEDRILAGVAQLKRAVLRVGDFEKTLRYARRGDFAYCDPPYITGHQNNGFLKYNAHLFSWDDQERLAALALRLKLRNVNVLISNADHDKVVALYKGYYYYRVLRRSAIAGDAASRGVAREALLSSYPLLGCTSEII